MSFILNTIDIQNKNLIDKHNYFLHCMIPNNKNIFSLKVLNEKAIKYFELHYKECRFLLFVVYKHSWSKKHLYIKTEHRGPSKIILSKDPVPLGYNFYNYEKGFKDIDLNEMTLDIKGENFYYRKLNYIFSFAAYSYIYLHKNIIINDNNITFYFILGVISEALLLSAVSIPFEQKEYSNIYHNFNFDTIDLKSLYISTQLKVFETWKHKQNVLLTGGTGIGKTSQIPKIYWMINYLFDGYEDNMLDFDNFYFNLNDINLHEIKSRNTVISLPRKILIKENSKIVYKSLGFKNIEGSPVSCVFKDVRYTSFYNSKSYIYISPLIFSINRNTKIKNINTIIFDEVHEHDTFCDINIMLSKHYKEKNKIRNIVLITATIVDDLKILSDYFPKMVHIDIPGKTLYSITELDFSHKFKYKLETDKTNIDFFTKEIIKIITTYSINNNKSTLLFLPTISMIKKMKYFISNNVNLSKYKILELHSISFEETNQEIISQIYSYPKNHVIVLTTPIAESSLTIENAEVVIDSGLFYSKRFFHGKIMFITRSMKEQRMGRVGRLFPGTYISLYSKKNINITYKKIDNEFLFPYIINCLYHGVSYKDMYILPTDMSRIDKTIKYYLDKNVDIVKDINKIYNIYNTKSLFIDEHIMIYLNNNIEEMNLLEDLSEIYSINDQMKYLYNNRRIVRNIAYRIDMKISISYIKSVKGIFKALAMINNFSEKENIISLIIIKKSKNKKDYYLFSSDYAI